MRGRSVFRAGLLLGVAVSALLLQASCATRGGAGGDGSGRGTGAGEVPERYADWTVVYSTGDNEVFSARLDGSGPRRLFAAGGEIDWSLLLRPVGELSEVLYERIRDGRLELMSFSAETGEVTSLASDIGDVVAVTDGRAFYIASGDGDEDVLWERDLRSGEARPVPTKGAVSGLGSAEASGPPLFSVARSDPRVDPVDQDLYTIEGRRPVKIASAPARHGFGPAFSLPAGVLFVVSEQGGEEHGSVRFWSRTTGETAELARHARILDASEHGGILLEEPLAGNGVRTSEGARAEGSRIVWFDSPQDDKPRRLDTVYPDLREARFCGRDTVLVSDVDGDEWRLRAILPRTGEMRDLRFDGALQVREIQGLDAAAALCVLDRVGADGLSVQSRLVWMPLTAGSEPVTLATTASGFIHMADPMSCPT